MARVTPQEYAEKWGRRTSAATADYTKGVNRVTEAPGIKAASKVDKLMNNFIESITSGKWARAVAGVTLQEWKDAATQKGAGRIAAGVAGAQPKMAAFAQQLLSHIDSVKAEVDAMPDTTLDERIAKSAQFQRRMADFVRS